MQVGQRADPFLVVPVHGLGTASHFRFGLGGSIHELGDFQVASLRHSLLVLDPAAGVEAVEARALKDEALRLLGAGFGPEGIQVWKQEIRRQLTKLEGDGLSLRLPVTEQEKPVDLAVLLHGLFPPVVGLQLGGQTLANLNVVGRKLDELYQGVEGRFDVTHGRRALGIGQEVLLGIRQEALACPDLTHAAEEDVPLGEVPEDLLADSDGIIGKLGLEVEVDGLFVMLHGRVGLTEAGLDVSHPIVQRDVRRLFLVFVAQCGSVEIQGTLPLLSLLVVTSLLFQLFDLHGSRTKRHACSSPTRPIVSGGARGEAGKRKNVHALR